MYDPILPLTHCIRGTVAEFIDPYWGDKVNCGIGLSHRPARLHGLAGRHDNLCRSWLYPPVMDLWIRLQSWMKEERDNTSRGRGLPTLHGLNLSTFQPSQRGFFRVHTSMWREREPEPEFSNFSGPQASIPQNWQIGFGILLSFCYTRTTTYTGGTDFLKIFAQLKSLKIWALENYVCMLRHTFTDS